MRLSRTIRNLTAFLFAFALVWMSASAEPNIDGRTALRRMVNAENSTSFSAHQVTTISGKITLTSEQDIQRVGFKKMRMDFTAPDMLRGEVMVDDGQVLSHYIPRARLLKQRPSMLNALRRRVMQTGTALKQGRLSVEVADTDRIAGRDAVVIEVKPIRHRPGFWSRYWVDTDKWVKLKTEDIAPDGKVVSTFYYTRIDFRNSIPGSKFRLDPPDGVKVEKDAMASLVSVKKAQKMVDFNILEPSYLPPSFKTVGATVRPFRGAQMVAIRYTDGVNCFSLFQTPGRTLTPGFRKRLHGGPVHAGGGVYSWKVGDLNLSIVGQIPPDQMERIAASVK